MSCSCSEPWCGYEDREETDMYFELKVEETDGLVSHEHWTVTCEYHVNNLNPLIEVTESTKEMSIETLTRLVEIGN